MKIPNCIDKNLNKIIMRYFTRTNFNHSTAKKEDGVVDDNESVRQCFVLFQIIG